MKTLSFIFLISSLISQKGFSQVSGAPTTVSGVVGQQAASAAAAAPVAAVKGTLMDKAKAKLEDAAPGATGGIGDFFASSAGVALLAGVSTVYSGVLYKAAEEQEDESKANIKKIDRIIATYKDSWTDHCPNGHDDLAVPSCYCYKDDGSHNDDRSKSQTCLDLWAKDAYKLTAVADNYAGVAKFVDPVGCVTVSGQFDENCKCKKFLDSKGNNACMKGANISVPSDSFGAALVGNTGLRDVMKFAAGSVNGNPNFNSFNSSSLGMKAIQTKQFQDSVISKITGSSNGGGSFRQVNEGNVGQIAKAILGEKGMAAAMGNSSGSAIAYSSSTPTDPKTAALLKTAAAKAGIELTGSGRGLGNKKADAKEAFNFNLGGDPNANAANQTQNFPEKEKVYKIQDISKRTDTSIFEIISNRYIQSGLKRLFDN